MRNSNTFFQVQKKADNITYSIVFSGVSRESDVVL